MEVKLAESPGRAPSLIGEAPLRHRIEPRNRLAVTQSRQRRQRSRSIGEDLLGQILGLGQRAGSPTDEAENEVVMAT